MEDSTAPAGGAAGGPAPVVFALSDLGRRLAALPDRRGRGRRYGLPLLLLPIVLAQLSGEDRPGGIAEWVAHRRARSARALGDLPRAPHHNPYRRVLARAVAPEALDAAIGASFRERPRVGRSVLVSIDGERIRGTMDAEDPHGAPLPGAYLPREGRGLLQLPAGDRDDEIRVAPAPAEALDLRGKAVAADALQTRRAFSAQLLAAGGAYLRRVKANRPTRRADIEELFTADARTVEGGQVRQGAKGHGRREVRRIAVSAALKGYSARPGPEQVFRLERERLVSKSGKHEREIAYGLTGLTPAEAPPARLPALTRA